MRSLQSILRQARIVPQLTELPRPEETCFLVGGAIRDWCLGRRPADFDFATPFDPTELGRKFADRIGGTWFFLDRERRQSRVVVSSREGPLTYDFAPFRAPDLATDLSRRDFTVNAIALPLPGGETDLVDPLHGRQDLEQGLIRACSEDVLREDPLRILKGARHALNLGFEIDPETAFWMKKQAPLLAETAPERRRNELAMILNAGAIRPAFALLQDLGLLPVLFGPSGDRGTIEAALSLAVEAETWAETLERTDRTGLLQSLLRQPVEDNLSRLGLLKLAGFLRGYAAPDLRALLAGNLRLSRSNIAVLMALTGLDPEKATEFKSLDCGPRGQALWAGSLGLHPVEHILFLGAIAPVLRVSPERVVEVLCAYRDLEECGRIPDLVTGDWIRERLGLPQGPLIGEILGRLRLEEISARVQTPEDAEKFVLQAAEKMVDKPKGGSL